jgi:hypothetical protein
MARTVASNFTGGLQFPYATTAADIFKKEDVQTLALAVDQHTHGTGLGAALAPLTAASIPNGLITSAMIADGTIVTADIADGQITSAKIVDGTITTADLAGGAVIAAYSVVGSVANPSTTSTALIDMPDMTADIGTTDGSTLLVWGVTSMNSSTTAGLQSMAVSYDGAVVANTTVTSSAAAVGYAAPLFVMARIGPVSGAAHQIRLRWATSASNSITALGTARIMIIVEAKR